MSVLPRRPLLAAACLTAGGVGLGLPAIASAAPHVSIQITTPSIEIGQPVSLRYSAAGVPRGAHVELQRTVGSAGVWRRVTGLSSGSGVRSVSGQTQGQHHLRVAVLNRRRHVLRSATGLVTVYGPTPLSQLVGRATKTVQIGGTLFRYAYGDYLSTDAEDHQLTAFKVEGSSCRSVALQIGIVMPPGSVEATPAAVTSEAADPTSTQAAPNTITPLSAPVVGDWSLGFTTDAGVNKSYYVNGSADCYTASGKTGAGS